MTTAEAKQLDLPHLLATLGFQPTKTTKQGQELWYFSPFRKEKTASFHTSYIGGKWIWKDFGGTGGNVIDFALAHLQTTDVKQALAFLRQQIGRVGEGQPAVRVSKKTTATPNPSSLTLLSVQPLSNSLILSYLTTARQLPEPLIRRHLVEVTYSNQGRTFFAFGIPNDAGGYEIRAASDQHPFKSVLGPRAISTIPGTDPNANRVSIFEGTLDYLSLLAIMNLDQLEGKAIIMHSLSSYQPALAALRSANYQTINLFLDNDESGVDVAIQFQHALPNAVNRAELYLPHKDLNDYWRASSGAPVTTPATATQEIDQLVEKICRQIFADHPEAKRKAYEAAVTTPGSGYRSSATVAQNMATPTFRAAFKVAVEAHYPDRFEKVKQLRIQA